MSRAPDINLAILFVSAVPRMLTRHLSGRYVEPVEHVGGITRCSNSNSGDSATRVFIFEQLRI